MPRALRVSVLAVLAITACGLSNGQGSQPLAPTAALAKWQDFPAHANPRPIIWFGGIYEHVSGFSTVDGKEMWLCGKFVLGPGVTLPGPAPGPASARWPSGVTATYPSIGADLALAKMLVGGRRASAPTAAGRSCQRGCLA
jgi:hypothetical protein